MAFLALDTSTEYLSLALYHEGQMFTLCKYVGQTHAETVIDTLRSFLQHHDLSIKNIQGIAFGKGPGAFTGLRIGCAIAQGLAFVDDIPLVGVSTLKALALQSLGTHIISATDARMGEIYLAMYLIENGQWQTLLSPMLCSPHSPPALPLGEEDIRWSGIGNGFSIQQQILATHYPLSQLQTEVFVEAREILLLALPQFAANQGVKAEFAEISYLRNHVALTLEERKKQ